MLTRLATPTNVVLALAWIAFLSFWAVSSIASMTTSNTRNWFRTIVMAAAIVGLLLLLLFSHIPIAVNLLLWQRNLLIGVCSDLVVIAGLVVAILARRTLGSNWSSRPEVKVDHKLVQTGPYNYVRHPMYSGFLTMVLGTAISYGRLLGAFIFAIFVVAFYFKAMREEAILKAHFPIEFSKYKARTKALIPFLL